MNTPLPPEPATQYVAPRDEPLLYPGRRPTSDFVLSAGDVCRIVCEDDSGSTLAGGRVWQTSKSRLASLDDFLDANQVVPIAQRYPVLAYGSNPVPGQLISKFGDAAVVPVFFGRISGWDTVYNLISNWGYAFAELMQEDEDVVVTTTGITFLDAEQLSQMAETEANYHLAHFPDDVVLESGEQLRGSDNGLYVFAGFRKTWVPEDYEGPVPIAEVPAEGRSRIALTQRETLLRVVEAFDLRASGIHTAEALVDRLRAEAGGDDGSERLKFEIQQAVDGDPASRPALADRLTVVRDPLSVATFGDTSR